MDKAYSKINWQNQPNTSTALGATNLNKMDKALDEIDNRTITLDATKLDLATANTMVKSFSLDQNTGVITITLLDGSTTTFDTKLEKIAINFVYDAETQRLVITLDDGTKQYVDMSALITQYEFNDSSTVGFSITDGKVGASVKDGSITPAKLQPNYLADITVQAQTATNQAKKSQRYAVGGVESGDTTDNAKYYKEQAELYKNQALQYRNEAEDISGVGIASNTNIGLVKGNGNVGVADDGAMWVDYSVDKGTDIQGTSINFPTSDNGLVHIKKIEGRTDQVVSTQGKNLFDLNRFVSNANTIYSVVNGALVVNATDTRTGTSALYWMKLSANTTYTLKTSEVTGIRIYVKGTTTEVVSVRSDVATFTTNSDSLEYAFKFVESSFPKTINTVQLEQGNTATTYEPFTPNTPSVEYPSPMNYATNIECSTIGKNILDVANPTSKTSDISNVSFNNGVLTLTSANAMGYSSMIYMLDKEKLKGRTITASHGGISASIGNARSIQVEYIVNGTTTYKTFTNGMVTFDVPSNISEIRFKVVTNNTSTATNITETITINNLQIEYGSTKTAYEPFKGYSRITVPFNAMSLPNGVKNTIEYKDGKLYKVDRVKEITLNGLETWTLQETMANTYRFNSVSAYVGAKDNPTEITKRCDKFKCTTVSDVSDTEHIRNPANNNPNTCIIYINKSRISSGDVASFKTWLSANPITIQYELTTPIYEEITPLYLTSYKGVTNVFNSANLPMTVDFKSELWSRDYLQDVVIDTKYDDTKGISFTTATTDVPINSGETIPTILGKLKKIIADIKTSLGNKFDKSNITSSDLVNDANKVPTSQVTYSLGQEIDLLDIKTQKIVPYASGLPYFVNNMSTSEFFMAMPTFSELTTILNDQIKLSDQPSTYGQITIRKGSNNNYGSCEFRTVTNTRSDLWIGSFNNGIFSGWSQVITNSALGKRTVDIRMTSAKYSGYYYPIYHFPITLERIPTVTVTSHGVDGETVGTCTIEQINQNYVMFKIASTTNNRSECANTTMTFTYSS